MQSKAERTADRKDYADFRILLVEDDAIMRMSLEDRLHLEGIPTTAVGDVASARSDLKRGDIDLVITDIRLPDGTGHELFETITTRFPGTPVILMTAFGDIADAVNLVKAGALDYLTKPFDINDFISKVESHLARIADTRLVATDASDEDGFKAGSGQLGKSPAMRRIERLIARLQESDSSVLITGESGVGKEVVATLIHHNSLRRQGPLVKVNCAALSPSLIESELFGHEKGAFTGATQQRIGRFEQAQRGTIFLDEIAEVSPEIQVKLLRVLQEREIERVGGIEPIKLDVRIIAATQVVLDESIENQQFRSDLYWRLNVIHIDVPPLRERAEDVLYLARQFVSEESVKTDNPVLGLTNEAEALLQSMSFPGNVRELKNIIERAVALCDAPWISPVELLPEKAEDLEPGTSTLRESVEEAERQAISRALIDSDNKITQAAEALGISRKSLWEKMKRYSIDKDRE
ncbi:MAG: sigma-54-dependent transcriptional regulator [Gammaproteobacteria bacterium]